MGLKEDDKKLAIELLIEKSNRHLEQAINVSKIGYWDLVVNRLYYSIFHAVTAMLLNDGILTKSHKGTAQQFGKNYVLTNKFDVADGRLYNRLQSKREAADYNNVFSISQEEGHELIELTINLQNKIIDYLK